MERDFYRREEVRKPPAHASSIRVHEVDDSNRIHEVDDSERIREVEDSDLRRSVAPRARRPVFLENNYDRSDRAPVVVRGRAAVASKERRQRSSSSEAESIRPVYRETDPVSGPPRIERVRIDNPLPPRITIREGAAEREVRAPSPRRAVDEVAWELSRTKDLTIHLELDVVEDLEPSLEEFGRLSRLGNFHEAKKFFQGNLEDHIENPFIFVQYAQMLLNMGDYGSLKTLKPPQSLETSSDQELKTNWQLIQSFSILHTEGFTEGVTYAISAAHNAADDLLWPTGAVSFRSEPRHGEARFGSTECQMLDLTSRILFYAKSDFKVSLLRPRRKEWIQERYGYLVSEGRIWDFRDMFMGVIFYARARNQRASDIFGTSEEIIGDWATSTDDESTNLALLDLFTSLVITQPLSPETFPATKSYLDKAGDFASAISRYHTRNLKSRQYIRWVLAKLVVASFRQEGLSSLLSELPGVLLPLSSPLDLHIYIPAASERPDWQLLCHPPKFTETLHMVLKAAREIGDFESEALCLKQLIAHAPDPAKLFDQLIHLQKTIQHDIEGWLGTCLAKYIICRDNASRDSLRAEILSVNNYIELTPTLVFARSMVLRALAHSGHESLLLLEEANANLLLVRPGMYGGNIKGFSLSFSGRTVVSKVNVEYMPKRPATRARSPAATGSRTWDNEIQNKKDDTQNARPPPPAGPTPATRRVQIREDPVVREIRTEHPRVYDDYSSSDTDSDALLDSERIAPQVEELKDALVDGGKTVLSALKKTYDHFKNNIDERRVGSRSPPRWRPDSGPKSSAPAPPPPAAETSAPIPAPDIKKGEATSEKQPEPKPESSNQQNSADTQIEKPKLPRKLPPKLPPRLPLRSKPQALEPGNDMPDDLAKKGGEPDVPGADLDPEDGDINWGGGGVVAEEREGKGKGKGKDKDEEKTYSGDEDGVSEGQKPELGVWSQSQRPPAARADSAKEEDEQ